MFGCEDGGVLYTGQQGGAPMLYLLAIVLPPLAVLLCGKPVQALLVNLPLTLLMWLPGIVHAWIVVHGHYADARQDRLIRDLRWPGRDR